MLKKFREFIHKHAIISSILIAVLFFVLMNGTVLIFNLFPRSTPMLYVEEIFGMLYSVALVLLLGYKDTFKFKGFFKGLLCSVVIIAAMIYALISFFDKHMSNPDTVWASTGMIIFGLVQAIGIGVREECFFRGAIQNVLAKKYANSTKGVWLAAFLGALFFGLVHALNVFTGINPLVVLVQTISAVGSGFFFAAIYLRSGNLWASILIHALIDTAALAASIFLTMTRTDAINNIPWETLFGMVIYVLPAFFLLRPSKCKEIIARFEAEREEKLPEQLEIN